MVFRFQSKPLLAAAFLVVFSGDFSGALADQFDSDISSARAMFEKSDCFGSTSTFTEMETCVSLRFELCRETIWDGAGVTRQVCNTPLKEYVDGALNATYQHMIGRLNTLEWGELAVEELRTAQRSWILTRDLSCDFIATAAMGNDSTWLDVCYADMTLLRIWAIKGFEESLYMLDQ